MTLDEAIKVGEIIQEADNGCPTCVHDLVGMAQEKFPEFEWEYDKEFVVPKLVPRKVT